MKYILILAFLCAGIPSSFAQESRNLNEGGCGTITTPQELQSVYDFVQHNPDAYAKGTGTVDSIPLTIHIVGDDHGNGYYKLDLLFPLICQLNTRYAPVGFYFHIAWPLHYIDDTTYYAHDYNTGYQMMYNNNVPNTVNVYFVADPAGNCGYFTPYRDGVAIAKSCAGNNSTTLAHELGHFFSLPHTFSGWENNTTPANPEKVTRGVGANCNAAGDGFCDTDADFLSERWSCPYLGVKLDQTGTPYHLDSSMYMSYSSDNCQSRFSAQQINKMQNNLHTAGNRAGIYNTIAPPSVAMDSVKFIYPTDTIYANLNKVVWHNVPGADYYYVRVTLQSTTSLIKQFALTSDTSLSLTFPEVDGGYYAALITPINANNTCMDKVSRRNFIYKNANGQVGIEQLAASEETGIQLYPNPLAGGQQLVLKMNNLAAGSYELAIANTAGQLVVKQTIDHTGGNRIQPMATPALPGGLYFVRLSGSKGQWTQKLIVQP